VGADQQRAWAGRVGVQTLDQLVQAVGDAVMQLRNALAFGRRNDDGVLFRGEVVGEMLGEDIVCRRRGVVESREAIELSQTRFEVDQSL
jgi:hypothetical protein